MYCQNNSVLTSRKREAEGKQPKSAEHGGEGETEAEQSSG